MHPGPWATLRTFHELGTLDRLELVVLSVLLSDGIPLSSPDAPNALQLMRSGRIFPDGSAELIYAPVVPLSALGPR